MAGEQRVGSPNGPRGGGPTSATAATFQVNDSSLKSMLQTWKMLTEQVGKFNAALHSLDKGGASVDKLSAKLAGLGLGGAGTGAGGSGNGRAPGMPPVPQGSGGSSNPTSGGSVNPPNGGHGGGGQGGGFWSSTGGRALAGTGTALVGGASAIGSYYGRSMGTISDLDLIANQGSRGMGYSRGGSVANMRTMQSTLGGYQSGADLAGGVTTLTQALGGGVGNARTNAALQSASGLAAAMPGMGYAAAAQGVAQLYNPVVQQRMRSMGVTPSGSAGANQSPGAIFTKIQRMVYRGQKITPNMIAEGMQPGAPLYVTLTALGVEGAAMEAFREYALTQANLGGSQERTDAALQYAATRKGSQQAKDDAKRAGLTDSIRSAQNRAGQSDTRREMEAGIEGKDGLQSSFSALARISDALTASFSKLNGVTGGRSGNVLGATGVFGGPVNSAIGHLGGVVGAGFAVQTLQGAWRGLRGGGGVAGAAAGAGRKAFGLSGAMGTPVFVTNWPGGGGGGGGSGGGGLPGAPQLPPGAGAAAGRFTSLGRYAAMRTASAIPGISGVAGTSFLSGGAFGGGVAGAAAPLALAAGVGVAGGLALRYGMKHHGLFGVDTDKEIKAKEDYAADSSLVDALHSLTTEGFMAFPEAADEYRREVRPKVTRAQQSRKMADLRSAVSAIKNLKEKYQARVQEVRNRRNFRSINTPEAAHGDGIGHSPVRISMSSSPETGDGPGGKGRGPATVTDIMGLAGGGPAHRASSTFRPGAHTLSGNLSYHATGNAVDFAGPKPSKDSPQLLAINKFFAQKFGKGLKELIYAGPGGINLLNGKPHVFSKNVRDIHHDHVHVAATKESLKRVGGVATSGSTDTSGGTTDAQSTDAASQAQNSNSSGASGGNMSSPPGVLADGMSALASVLNQSMFGGGGGGSQWTPKTANQASAAAGKPGTDTATGATKQVGSMPVGDKMSNAKVIVAVAKAMGLTKRGAIIGIATAEQESGLRNLHSGDRDSQGLFQQRPSQGWGSVAQVTNPQHAAQSFFSRLKGTDYNHLPLTVAAQKVQRSGYPNAYAKWENTATQIVNQIGYSSGSMNVDQDQLAAVHKGEIILPARDARKVRSMLRSSSAMPAMAAAPSSAVTSGSRTMQVTVHAPIQLAGKATAQDARDYVQSIKAAMEDDDMLMKVGG